MLELQEIEQDILRTGKVDGPELEVLRRSLYGHGKEIDRRQADYLVEIYKRVQHHTPAFDRFFYTAVKDYLLAGSRIDTEKTAWLQHALFAGRKIQDEDRKCLHEVRGEAKLVGRKFELLFHEIMKQPPEQRTSG